MKFWRLYRRAHGPGLDGAGGRYASGRWHQQGTPVVYFGAGAAIVVLEKLAHLNPDTLPSDLMLGLFEAAVSVEDIWPGTSREVRELEDIDATRTVGQRWLESGRSCVLRVPSVVVPEEHNLVLNPQHPQADRLALTEERPFEFDGLYFDNYPRCVTRTAGLVVEGREMVDAARAHLNPASLIGRCGRPISSSSCRCANDAHLCIEKMLLPIDGGAVPATG